MYFEQNANALFKNRPEYAGLIETLRNVEPVAADDLLLIPSEDGQCAFRYKDVWLHDAISPVDEVKRVFQSSCKPKADHAHLIMGLGLGYALDEAVHNSPSPAIIVYEPDLSLLRFALDNVELQELLVNSRVQIATTQADLMKQVMPLIYGYFELDFLVLPGSAQRLANELPVIAESIRTIMIDWTRNYKTGLRFHKLWLNQFFQNLTHFPEAGGFDDLVNCFQGRQALIISRGPSLDPAMNDVVALKDSAVLVAVGSALRHLWQAGVVPDFAVFVDANGLEEQLHGLPESFLNQVVFVIGPYLQPCVFNYPARAKLVFLSRSTKEVSDWLDQALQTKHQRLDAGGTVSLFALQLALYLGCSNIVLIGQDLAMPNNQVYAGGVALQTDAQGNMSLTSTDTLYAEPEPMTTILGQDGQIMKTLKTYSTFARQLVELAEKVKAKSPYVKLYNASLGGAHLEGYELSPLSAFKDQWPAWKTGVALLEVPGQTTSQQHQRARQLARALEKLKQELSETKRLCEKLLAQLPKQIPTESSSNALRSLEDKVWNSVSQFISFLQQKPFVAFLLMFDTTPFKQRFVAYRDEPAFRPEMAQDLSNSLQQFIQTLTDDYGTWIHATLAQFNEMPAKR